VTKLTNFGVFVQLEPNLEGLLHISELSDHKVENPEQIVKVGDEIEVRILRVDTSDRKIGLSRKLSAPPEEIAAEAQGADGAGAPGAPREELKGGRDSGQSGPLFTMEQTEP
jgi:small subunit ribosomal protein S1